MEREAEQLEEDGGAAPEDGGAPAPRILHYVGTERVKTCHKARQYFSDWGPALPMVWIPTDGKHLTVKQFGAVAEALLSAPQLAEKRAEIEEALGPDLFGNAGRCVTAIQLSPVLHHIILSLW